MSFTTRRVVAIQHGKPIFTMSASFQVDEPGVDHADPDAGCAAARKSLPTYAERIAPIKERMAVWGRIPRPFDVRYVDDPPWVSRLSGPQTEAHNKVWFRADGVLPDDDLLHVCVLAYLSDLTLLYSVLATHALSAEFDRYPDGIAGPRDVVPPAVPGRRLGAVRHQLAQRLRGPRTGHRALLRPGGTAAGDGRPGGSRPAALTSGAAVALDIRGGLPPAPITA